MTMAMAMSLMVTMIVTRKMTISSSFSLYDHNRSSNSKLCGTHHRDQPIFDDDGGNDYNDDNDDDDDKEYGKDDDDYDV